MRQKFVAGNWKMNLTLPEAQALTSEIVQMLHDETLGANAPQVVICPPFPLLP
jgi:triosephosphate isomerase